MTQPDALAKAPAQGQTERGLGGAFVNEVRALLHAERRGDLAELRRLTPEHPDAPAFFRILARVAPEAGVKTMRLYAHYLRILALNPQALSDDRLGAVMAKSGVSESRVQRLLIARAAALDAQLRLIARRLANSGNVPWRGFADLMLAADEEQAEHARLRIARDYWRALDGSQNQS